MLTFAQLRAAQPDMWQHAADEWLSQAKEMEACAEDIWQTRDRPLDEAWTDETGDLAKSEIALLARSLRPPPPS
ncbi:hypothetical protein [Prescottella agglutinans]|uniref:Uncharacterized protein n=1 Tax=Prescottella agglutinans TaxID=1644129 RepID=A0ABT6ML05_9NOCA|nr:hypothetical protein [Prescottella agglutinans]MDH6284451.1 hypothetical protein [Prescottella agglutinans]